MNKLNYFLMAANVACMALAVASFTILPSTKPDDPVPSFMMSLKGSMAIALVMYAGAIGVHVCSICHMIPEGTPYSIGMAIGHWVASAICVGAASPAGAGITFPHFRHHCVGSLQATCQSYEIATGLAGLLGTLSIIVAMVVNVARLMHGQPILPIAWQGQGQGQGQGQH